MEDHVEGFSKAKEKNILYSSFILQASHLFMEGNLVG